MEEVLFNPVTLQDLYSIYKRTHPKLNAGFRWFYLNIKHNASKMIELATGTFYEYDLNAKRVRSPSPVFKSWQSLDTWWNPYAESYTSKECGITEAQALYEDVGDS